MFPVDAVGRLIVDGKYLCTAFPVRTQVIRPSPHADADRTATHRNWLVTAGHCVGKQMMYRQPVVRRLTADGLVVYPERMHPAVTVGFSGRPPGGFDVAVLEYTTSYPAPILELAFGHRVQEGQLLLAVGYSRGVLNFTIDRYLGRNEDDQLVIDAVLSSGGSGGPVLIPGTRRVVGIVVEGTLRRTDEGVHTCMFKPCPTERPYKAAPVNWILGVVRW
jgi:hypothetical protein